jgi:hypothetical protein
MRTGVGVAAAMALAAAFSLESGRASAESDEVGGKAPLTFADEWALAGPDGPDRDDGLSSLAFGPWPSTTEFAREQARFLLFSSADIWRHGGFGYGGVLWSPRGLDRQGVVVKLVFGGGLYRYISGALGNAEVTGRQITAAILPGWRFVRGSLIVTVFAGLELQEHRLSPDDPSAGLRGTYWGARAGFELWYEPSPTTMIAADASASNTGWSYSARVAGGWRVFDLFYVGPELQAFAADDNYRQFRAGLHLTALRTGVLEWSAGLGFAGDSDDRGSIYGKLGLLTRR